MARLGVRYFIFWLFLAGICIIVFLQVISGYNTNLLIEGNRSLLNELRIQNEIQQLQSGVLTFESDIRGAVITEDSSHLKDVEEKIANVERLLQEIKTIYKTRSASKIDELERQVEAKIIFNHQILDAFHSKGKSAAEELINTNKGKEIRDSITLLIAAIDRERQVELQQINDKIEQTGRRARIWGYLFSTVALVLVVFAFLYIMNKGRQQSRMIQALNESEKRNREAAILKEQFMANMSHEIRTPINAILGFTNLLKTTRLDSDQSLFVRNIHSSGENLLVLINDILDLSKIEAGMMNFERNSFSLRSLISSVASMFSEKTRQKKLLFHQSVDEDVPDHLIGDPVRLTQILNNLLSNAVKFTERGAISLEVKVLNISDDQVRLQIIIADTGIGISADKKGAIFERFQQAEAETTRRYGGTGLGLSIVKELVDLQGGRIRVESEVNKGSQFIFELTFGISKEDVQKADAATLNITMEEFNSVKVLIAEDNAMNQQLIDFLMKKWSAKYTLVANGLEAIEALRKESYSLILMDIQMPEMDGYSATQLIRNELKSDIPIIAMTAHAMAGEREKCMRLGMNDYISKPIKESLLYNLIKQYAIPVSMDTGNEKGVIDLEYLQQLSGNDKEFEKQLLQQFLVQTPVEVQQLQQAIEENDPVKIKRTAHSLKSTVGYVGLADVLHPSLERLEKSGSNGVDLQKEYSVVKSYCDRALEEIKMML